MYNISRAQKEQDAKERIHVTQHQHRSLTQHKCRSVDIPEDADPLAVVTYVVEQRYQDEVTQGLDTADFSHHVEIYTDLLKRVHRAVTQDHYKTVLKQLRTCVYATCIVKMHRRLKIGIETLNFFDTITQMNPDQKRALLHDWQDSDVPTHLKANPTGKQLKNIEEFFSAKYPERNVENIKNESVYGGNGRARFHTMLRRLLQKARDALNELYSEFGAPPPEGQPKNIPRPDEMEKIAEIARLVASAEKAVHTLAVFLNRFDKADEADKAGTETVLFVHLDRIRKVCEGDAKRVSTQPLQAVETGSSAPDEEEEEELSGSPFHATWDEEEELIDVEEIHNYGIGWAWAARKWLRLICLHDSSLTRITGLKPENKSRAKQILSQRISDTKLTVLEVNRGAISNLRWPFSKCIEAVIGESPDLHKKILNAIIGKTYESRQGIWTGEDRKTPIGLESSNNVLNAEAFSGTFHCETLLLSLWAAAQDRGFMKAIQNDPEWLEDSQNWAVHKNLLDLSGTPFPLLTVSRRTCLACRILIRQIMNAEKIDSKEQMLLMPDHGSYWCATALPPFLPKNIGNACLKEVENELIAKLRELQETFLRRESLSQTREYLRRGGSLSDDEGDDNVDYSGSEESGGSERDEESGLPSGTGSSGFDQSSP